MITEAKSITHQHLLSILHTESEGFSTKNPLRILDIGCGDGHLISYLTENISLINPDLEFEIYGFDVDDHGVQSEGYFTKTIGMLEQDFPKVPWSERLHVSSAKEAWPYEDGFFDIILSNHVIEHVGDHDLFFSEIDRTLNQDGFSAHLFPLKHYIYESHLHLPLVHKIANHDYLVSYIKCLSKLGFGKYKGHNKEAPETVEAYSERHGDYLFFFTNYLTYGEVLKYTKKYHLPATFRYTQEFYTAKIRSILGRKPQYKYKTKRSSLLDWFAVFFLRYVSSVTMVIHKNERYTDI